MADIHRRFTPRLLLVALVAMLAVNGVAPSDALATQSERRDRSIGDEVNLAPRLESANAASYRLSVASTQVLSILGQTEETGASMEAGLSVEVIDAAATPTDDGAEASLEFDYVAVAFEGGVALDGSFDSRQPEADDDPGDPLVTAIRPVVGKALTLTLAADGTITSVDGLDELRPEGDMPAMLFQQLFSERALTSMMQPIFRVRPAGEDEPLNERGGRSMLAEPLGGSWPVRAESVRTLGIPAAELTLTLDSAARGDDGDRLATISIDGEPEAEAPARTRALDPKVSERRLSGEAVWNATDGLLQSLESTSTTNMVAEGQFTVEISVDASSTLERTD
jgi:hypothetical protein